MNLVGEAERERRRDFSSNAGRSPLHDIPMSSRALAILALVVLGALNVWIDLLHVRETHRAALKRPPPLSHYSELPIPHNTTNPPNTMWAGYVEDDLPPRMPLPSARRGVKLMHEESARYGLWTPEADSEWLWTATVGDGNVHYGPNHRLSVVSITHQLHCLRSYRQALAQAHPPRGHQLGHLTHCINFFRMSTLCAADTTLEPPDAFAHNYTQSRAGGEHVCMDWPGFYEEMKANYMAWQEVQERFVESG